MKKLLAILLSTTCALSVVPALSQETPPPIPFETVTVKESIDPGPNLFLMDQSWDGASTLQVFDAIDLTYKGGMGTGMPNWGTIFREDEMWALVDTLYTFLFDDSQ